MIHGRTARFPNHIPHIKPIHDRVWKDNGLPCFAKWICGQVSHFCYNRGSNVMSAYLHRGILQRLPAVYRGMDSSLHPLFRSFGSNQRLAKPWVCEPCKSGSGIGHVTWSPRGEDKGGVASKGGAAPPGVYRTKRVRPRVVKKRPPSTTSTPLTRPNLRPHSIQFFYPNAAVSHPKLRPRTPELSAQRWQRSRHSVAH